MNTTYVPTVEDLEDIEMYEFFRDIEEEKKMMELFFEEYQARSLL